MLIFSTKISASTFNEMTTMVNEIVEKILAQILFFLQLIDLT